MAPLLQQQDLLLTPNRRLARYLRQEFDQVQSKPAWVSTPIQPIDSWLKNLWSSMLNPSILLNATQELILWQQIITKVSGAEYASYAMLAQEASSLSHEWELSFSNNFLNEDCLTFQKWHQEFIRACREKNFLSKAELIPHIINWLQTTPPILPKTIYLCGFEQLTPQQQRLFDALAYKKCAIETLDFNNCGSKQQLISFPTLEEEIQAVARWAKQILEQKPTAKIGCVVPNLTVERSKLERIFNTVFAQNQVFNISAGQSLNSLPLTQFILQLLNLPDPIDINSLSNFLLSPYFAFDEQEFAYNSMLIAKIKRQNLLETSWQKLSNILTTELAEEKHVKKISLFFNELKKVRQNFTTKKAEPATWVKIFSQEIQQLGRLNLNSKDFLVLERLQVVFSEFAALNFLVPFITRTKAVHLLQTLTANTIFQLPTTKYNVDILGTLEAAGINFDYLWIMGMDAEHWPSAPSLNPFLPKELQKQFGLPHATAAKELQFCQNLTRRFARSAPEVNFSYVNIQDEQIVPASPLLNKVKLIQYENLNLPSYTPDDVAIFQKQNLETYHDDLAPKVTTPAELKGGSKIFELQSLCPFRAFATIRLQAEAIPEPEIGISKQTRGTILHLALELIWRELKTQSQLCAQEPKVLYQLVQKSLDKALTTHLLQHLLLNFETENLTNLLLRFLVKETTREPFTVISTEKTLTTVIGTIPVKLRIDRIDALDDRTKLIIDYKTGKNVPFVADFLGERPRNMQLPLYAVLNQDASAFAIAHINIAKVNFNIITLEKINNYLKTPEKQLSSWQELLRHWQSQLEQLALDFMAGHAKVDPIDTKVCATCDLSISCRIKAQTN